MSIQNIFNVITNPFELQHKLVLLRILQSQPPLNIHKQPEMVQMSEAETVGEVVEEELVDLRLYDPVRLILMTYLLLL